MHTSLGKLLLVLAATILGSSWHTVHSQSISWESFSGPYGPDLYSVIIHRSGNICAGPLNNGLYVSTDNGSTWHLALDTLKTATVRSFLSNGDTLLAGAGAILRSVDGGMSWQIINETPQSIDATSLVRAPSGALFASTWGAGVFRSSDEGVSWESVNTGLRSLDVRRMCSDTDGNLFAALYHGGVWRSTDSGGTWTDITSSLSLDAFGVFAAPDGSVWASTSYGLHRSNQHGDNWVPVNTGLAHIVECLQFDDGTVYAGTGQNGIFRSTDNGQSWAPVSQMISQSHVMDLCLQPGGGLVAATLGQGIMMSTDAGYSWRQKNVGLGQMQPYILGMVDSATYCVIDIDGEISRSSGGGIWVPVNGAEDPQGCRALVVDQENRMFVGTNGSGVYRSTDGGASWVPASSGLSSLIIYHLSPVPSGRLYAVTSRGINVSTDNGSHWQLKTASFAYTNFIIVPWNSSDTLLAWAGNAFYESTDGASTWSGSNTLPMREWINSMVSDLHGSIFAATARGVYHSTDRGSTWMLRNAGLTDTSIALLLVNQRGDVFAVSESCQAFVSQDTARSWNVASSGLLPSHPSMMALSPTGYACIVTDVGIFRTIRSTITGISQDRSATPERAQGFVLLQNYPNPFNPSTTIRFELPKASEVRLSVYDMLGREVTVLVNERKDAGVHEVTFDATGLSSGVYFYRLTAGNFIQTRRFLLLR